MIARRLSIAIAATAIAIVSSLAVAAPDLSRRVVLANKVVPAT